MYISLGIGNHLQFADALGKAIAQSEKSSREHVRGVAPTETRRGLVHSLIEVRADHVGSGRGNVIPVLPYFAIKPVAAAAADVTRRQLIHLVVGKIRHLVVPVASPPIASFAVVVELATTRQACAT